MTKFDEDLEPLLLSYRGAEIVTSLERTTIERKVKAGTFPQPVEVSDGRKAFVTSEVRAWVRKRIAGRDAAVAREESGPTRPEQS